MQPLLTNPEVVESSSIYGNDEVNISQITKYLQTKGEGLLPAYNDRVIYNLEIRYSNGMIYDLKERKEQKKVSMMDDKAFKFFLI
jgi:hypothetical protein